MGKIARFAAAFAWTLLFSGGAQASITGTVRDVRPLDGEWRAPLRLCAQLLPRAGDRPDALPADGIPDSGEPGRDRLQGLLATTSLGRPLSNSATSATINVAAPGSVYGDRISNVDLRIAKVLRFGRSRTNIGLDLYNIFNANPVLTYNQTYSPTSTTWLTPNSILSARFVKFSANVDF